jgi:hypothetical protein
VGSIVSVINSLFKEHAGYFQAIPVSMTLFMTVWGVLLWANMSTKCDAYYSEAYWALYLVFKIQVVVLSVLFVIGLLALCAMLIALFHALGSVNSRPDRYENIPDTVEEIGRQAEGRSGPQDSHRAAQASNIPATETYV